MNATQYKVEGCGKSVRTTVKLSSTLEAMAEQSPEHAEHLAKVAAELGVGDDAEIKRKPKPSIAESLEDGSRTAIQYFSTLHLDHSRDVVVPEGAMLKEYRRNPVVFLDHDYSKLIGTDEWTTKTERGLLARTRYSTIPRADEVFTLKQEGILKSQSIGFLPVETVRAGEKRFGTLVDRWRGRLADIGDEEHGAEADGIKVFHTKYLVVEHSDVALPDNAHAVSVAVAKALGRHPELTREFFEDDLAWKFLPEEIWKSSGPDQPPTEPQGDEPDPERVFEGLKGYVPPGVVGPVKSP